MQEKGEAETEQASELTDHEEWESRRGERVSKNGNSCRKEKHRKGEAQEKGEAETEQDSESADHEKWERRSEDRAKKEKQPLKGEA